MSEEIKIKKSSKKKSTMKGFDDIIGRFSEKIDKHIKSRASVERRLNKLLSKKQITQEEYDIYIKDRSKARKELFLDKGEYITPVLQGEIKAILADINLFETERSLYEACLVNQIPNTKDKGKLAIQTQMAEKIKKEDIYGDLNSLRDVWGNEYPIPTLHRFQKFYKNLVGDKEPKSEIYKMGLIKFTRYSILAEISAEKNDTSGSVKYEKLATEVAKSSGIQIGEVDESVTAELFLHPLWFKYVEEAIDIIPKWIELEPKAFDELDVYSWATTNYNRHLFNLPPASYKGMFDYIYDPYKKFLKMKKFSDEQIEEKLKERIKGFETLDLDNNIDMQEPLYIKENINEEIFQNFKDEFDIVLEDKADENKG